MDPLSQSTVLTFGGILLLLQIANFCVNIYAKLRRRPPIDQTLQDYVRREEFDRLRDALEKRTDELRRTDGKLFDELRAVTDKVATFQQGIAMQLGRIDNALTTQKDILRRILQK